MWSRIPSRRWIRRPATTSYNVIDQHWNNYRFITTPLIRQFSSSTTTNKKSSKNDNTTGTLYQPTSKSNVDGRCYETQQQGQQQQRSLSTAAAASYMVRSTELLQSDTTPLPTTGATNASTNNNVVAMKRLLMNTLIESQSFQPNTDTITKAYDYQRWEQHQSGSVTPTIATSTNTTTTTSIPGSTIRLSNTTPNIITTTNNNERFQLRPIPSQHNDWLETFQELGITTATTTTTTMDSSNIASLSMILPDSLTEQNFEEISTITDSATNTAVSASVVPIGPMISFDEETINIEAYNEQDEPQKSTKSSSKLQLSSSKNNSTATGIERKKQLILKDVELAVQSSSRLDSINAFYKLLQFVQKLQQHSEAPTESTVQQQQQQQQSQPPLQVMQHHKIIIPSNVGEINFIPIDLIKKLFLRMSLRYPFDAYKLLIYYQKVVQYELEQQQQLKQRTVDTNDDTSAYNDKMEDYWKREYLGMYHRICYSMRCINPETHTWTETQYLIRSVLQDIRTKFGFDGEMKCYPTLVAALVVQRSVQAGTYFVPMLYQYIHETGIMSAEQEQSPGGWYEHLLGLSKYHRQNDLPYAQILHKLVFDYHRRPTPPVVLSAIDNLFPFNNLYDMKLVLQSVLELQKQPASNESDATQYQSHDSYTVPEFGDNGNEGSDDNHAGSTRAASTSITRTKRKHKKPPEQYRYHMDIAALEAISTAAANSFYIEIQQNLNQDNTNQTNEEDTEDHENNNNDSVTSDKSNNKNSLFTTCMEVNMLLWDLLDIYKYPPSVTIYENTATMFAAAGPATYAQTFSVLIDMEQTGLYDNHMKPTRSLIRCLSTHIRPNPDNIELARKEINAIYNSGNAPLTPTLLNVILSSYAERGDGEAVYSILVNDFPQYNIPRNADSYSFGFEALGKGLLRARRKSGAEVLTEKFLRYAESLLSMMEEDGIQPTHHIIREYVELLCQTGQVDTASDVVLDAASAATTAGASKNEPLINSKIIYRVAMANCRIGQFDTARKVAALASFPSSSSSDPGKVVTGSSIPNLIHNINTAERTAKISEAIRNNEPKPTN